MTEVARTQNHVLAVDHPLDHHRALQPVSSAVAVALKANSVPKICSTCSSVEVWVAVAVSVVVLVRSSFLCHVYLSLVSRGFADKYRTVFSATFGPGGFRTTRVHTANARHRQTNQTATENTPRSVFLQLMPLLVLFAFSLLSAIPNLFTTPPTPDPRFSFQASTRYNMERTTTGLKIPFYVNSAEFSGHPIAAEIAKAASVSAEKGKGPTGIPRALKKFEDSVDKAYVQDKYSLCQRGMDFKQRRKDEAIGFFGIGADWEKVKAIENEKIEACEILKGLGYLQ